MLRRRVFLGLAFAWLMGWTLPAYAERGPGAIRWKVHSAASSNSAASSKAATPDVKTSVDVLTIANERHMVVQFKHLPGTAERARLQASGMQLLRYLGDNAYFARVNGTKGAGKAAVAAGLHAAFNVKYEWKLHPKLLSGDIPAYSRIPAGLVQAARSRLSGKLADQEDMLALYVVFHPDVDMEKAGADAVVRHGGTVRSFIRSINGAVIWLPAGTLTALAGEDEVQWVEPPLPPMTVTNDSIRLITQADEVQAAPYGLTGNGIDVLVYDGGTALASHLDFGGRLNVRDNTVLDDHPTHVAGTIGGSGVVSGGLYRGMAPGVTMESFGLEYDAYSLYTDPSDLQNDYDKAINIYGAVVANNSIGTNVASNNYSCDWEGDYSVTDMLIDAIVIGSLGSPMRVIWANGNERGSGRCGTTYRTTAPPACAKNHITVGAVNSDDEVMTSFSSWGPVDDGRLKPDICAPGCQVGGDQGVTSTLSNGGYGVRCGTSMAAPVITGLVALLLEDWRAQFPGEPLPPNSMVKTLLVQNANDLGDLGPDYQTGYGSVRIKDTIDFLRSHSFSQDSVELGEEARYFVSVTDSNVPMKVTIAWDDPPGAVNTAPELVNDLDLRVVAPNGATYYPWTLDPNNPSVPAVRTQADHLNNIEQVVVDYPAVGTWTVIVNGTSVPEGPQSFSVAGAPALRLCSSSGTLRLNTSTFRCADTVVLHLRDCDLDTDSGTVQTATVNIASTSDPVGVPVLLSETAPEAGSFTGTIATSAAAGPGVLWVAHGDTITATYVDADNGLGQQNVNVYDTALVDCAGPVVSKFQTANLTSSSTQVTLTTDEPAQVQVRYGLSCTSLTSTVGNSSYEVSHTITLTGLVKNTDYFLVVDAVDEAGNWSTTDNSGACFTFRTADRQDYFTQLFGTGGFDLNGKVLTFTPTGTLHKYATCLSSIADLPIDPQGSTQLTLADDAFATVGLADGKTVTLYGVAYNTFYVGTNGYVTFTVGDTAYSETLAGHFRLPRISPIFNDFVVGSSGKVTWRQLPNCAVVTWDHVSEWNAGNYNTFQVVMYFDGTIEMAWSGVAAISGLVGLSAGNGVPEDFGGDDLSATGACSEPPAKAFDPHPGNGQMDVSVVGSLSWGKGLRATAHEVYFGMDPGALVFKGSQLSNVFALPALANDMTYYWRIDEVNASGRSVGDSWAFTTRSLKADFDHDGDVDMSDYGYLQMCLSGESIAQNDPSCQDAKLDGDADVDAADVSLFYGCLSGPNQPADGVCLP